MSEKDIKTKPKTTTKAVHNTPKAADRFAKEAVKDIKTVSKDVLSRILQISGLTHGSRSSRSEPKLRQPNRLKILTIPPLIPFTKKVNILRKIS